MASRKPRKPKDFDGCMLINCDEFNSVRYVNLRTKFPPIIADIKKLKRFHTALGKAIEWAEYKRKRIRK